jgi:uncharacterized RmlC-like cupin family protein
MFWDSVSVPSSRVKSPSRKESQSVTYILTGKVHAGWGSVSVMIANRVEPGITEGWMKREHTQNKVRIRE